ncbi:hypothetical protein BC938DRAFT_482192, partial [Jimgerdemannia flammicorona]
MDGGRIVQEQHRSIHVISPIVLLSHYSHVISSIDPVLLSSCRPVISLFCHPIVLSSHHLIISLSHRPSPVVHIPAWSVISRVFHNISHDPAAVAECRPLTHLRCNDWPSPMHPHSSHLH